MEKRKVSIVLPVYNIARWLDECVQSLVSQRYQNIEILLGDDGSTDGSGELCDRWAEKDNRVRVIHKPNGGAASARNVGLDRATGDYICFVDSDDVVDEDYVAHLVETMEQADADVAICGFYYLKKSGSEVCSLSTATGVYSGREYMLRFLKDWSCSLLWNKLFRREMIGDIRMDEGHRVDDEYFTYQVCMNAKTVAVSDKPLYYYRMRASSVMNVPAAAHERTMLDRVGYITQRYTCIAQNMPDIEEPFFYDTVDTMVRYWQHSKNMPQAQQRIRQWAKQHRARLWKSDIPIKQKLAYDVALFFKKPIIIGEPNSISISDQDYFE